MPICIQPLADSYRAITRRIVYQVVRQMIKEFSLPIDTYIQFKGEASQVMTYNSELDKLVSVKNTGETKFGYYDKLVVEVKEESVDGAVGRMQFRVPEVPEIWHDGTTNIRLYPLYHTTGLNISMTYYTSTLVKAEWFYSMVAEVVARSGQVYLSDIQYYIIPDNYINDLLATAFNLREKQGGYGGNFKSWVEKNASQNSLTILNNIAGRGETYAFREKQINIPLFFSATELPDGSKRDKSPGHEYGVELRLEYDKPIGIYARYPITIHNSMLPARLIPKMQSDNNRKDGGVVYHNLMGDIKRAVGNLDWVVGKTFTGTQGVIVPLGDDWKPTIRPNNVLPILTALTPIRDDRDLTKPISDINAFGKYLYLHPSLKGYLKYLGNDMKDVNRTILSVSVFHDCHPINIKHIYIDNGKIYCDFPMTVRDVCHITLNLTKDLKLIERDAFVKLAKYPEVADYFIDIYAPTHVKNNEIKTHINNLSVLLRSKYAQERDIHRAVAKLRTAFNSRFLYSSCYPMYLKVAFAIIVGPKFITDPEVVRLGQLIVNVHPELTKLTDYARYQWVRLNRDKMEAIYRSVHPTMSDELVRKFFHGEYDPSRLQAVLVEGSYSADPSNYVNTVMWTVDSSYICAKRLGDAK